MGNLSPRTRHISVAIISLTALGIVILRVGSENERGPGPSLEQVDGEGNEWSLALLRGQRMAAIRRSDQPMGTPLTVGVDIRQQGGIASIGLLVTGQAGERYVGGVLRNGTMLPPPRFKIVAQSGKVLGSGRFKYG